MMSQNLRSVDFTKTRYLDILKTKHYFFLQIIKFIKYKSKAALLQKGVLYQKYKEGGLMHNVVLCSEFIHTYTHTHTHTHTHTCKDTAQTEARRLRHPHKYIFTTLVMCSQQLSLLHWINNWLISKIYFTDVLSFQTLFTCKSHISID